MTAQQMTSTVDEQTALTVDLAYAHVATGALRASDERRVGLELEAHLVDLAQPGARPTWSRVQSVLAALPGLPGSSSVTVEPGGQIELSTPPLADVTDAVQALGRDRAALQRHLAEHGLGAAAIGADPARTTQRINPGARYVAMEQHFAAIGCGRPARAMMTATAALQINLDAGPGSEWRDRLSAIHSVLPALVAASAASPYLAGRSSGWQSMRRQAWHGIDARRTAALADGDPATAWADYALAAPVMLVRDTDGARPVMARVPFEKWLLGHPAFDRRPTLADLDYHLSTLFPPVRPRGYLEIRGLDALPDRWWPGLVAFAVTLLDDPVAADAAVGLMGGLDESTAARVGCREPDVRRVVLACLDIATRRAPAALGPCLDDLAVLLESGRSVSDLLRERVEQVGPLRVLEEEAHA